MVEEEEVRIESRIAPPPLSCPKCEELLPPDLGELNCSALGKLQAGRKPSFPKLWTGLGGGLLGDNF